MGSKSDAVVVGYDYYMGVHAAISHGPVDAVTEIVVGERSAWTGDVTTSTTIVVDKPELFGGKSREGGVKGNVEILMGEPTQPQNSYLQGMIGSNNIPAFRGLCTVLFRSFLWSSLNPYFKSPWIRARRILKGWDRDTPWYTTKARIGSFDMNPAHIIYQCLTDTRWGMGYSSSELDNTSFTAVADQLYTEGFGLSLMWTQQVTIQDFIRTILDHINGSLRLDLQTGKFVLKLIRDGYTIDSLRQLNKTNIVELTSFQRAAWGDTVNELVIKYTSRDDTELSVVVQDLAGIEAQGGVVSATREYPGIRDDALARRVALRDLATVSAPLAKVVLTCNRVMWDQAEGDVFSLVWEPLGIAGVPFRIAKINKGNLLSGKIEIEAVEDVFGLPTTAYTGVQPPGWVDPVQPPHAVLAAKLVEAPYWDVVRTVPAATLATLGERYAFGQVLATYGSGMSSGFEIHASPDNVNYGLVSQGHYAPNALLNTALTRNGTTVVLKSTRDLDLVKVGDYFYLDAECIAVKTINTTTNTLTVDRGVLDTTPVPHSVDAPVWFAVPGANDPTERAAGELVYYKPCPTGPLGKLPLASATALNITLVGRPDLPYPPGNPRINDIYAPDSISSTMDSIKWSHRNRLSQTVSLTPQTTGDITPEPGTSYTVRISYANDLVSPLALSEVITAIPSTLNGIGRKGAGTTPRDVTTAHATNGPVDIAQYPGAEDMFDDTMDVIVRWYSTAGRRYDIIRVNSQLFQLVRFSAAGVFIDRIFLCTTMAGFCFDPASDRIFLSGISMMVKDNAVGSVIINGTTLSYTFNASFYNSMVWCNTFILAGANGTSIYKLSTSSMAITTTLTTSETVFYAVGYDPLGILALGNPTPQGNSKLLLIDETTGATIRSMACDPRTNFVLGLGTGEAATSSYAGLVQRWNLTTGSLITNYTLNADAFSNGPSDIRLFKTGNYFSAGAGSGVTVYDTANAFAVVPEAAAYAFTPIDAARRIKVELWSVRDGLSSYQIQVLEFTTVPAVVDAGYGYKYGYEYGGQP